MNLSETIQKTALFRGMPSQSIEILAGKCKQKSFKKGQEIFALGDTAESFYIVVQGWIKLYRLSREGVEAIIHVFGPGESFAEAAVFNQSQTYPANAQAVEDSILLEVPRIFFIDKILQDSRFALSILGSIASRQHFLVQQLEQVTTRTAPQRIGAFLLRFCRKKEGNPPKEWLVDLPYDKSVISARLNIKPETFSRALTKLKPYGVRVDNQRRITITNMKILAEFCDLPFHEMPR